jgi:hypothetical protein
MTAAEVPTQEGIIAIISAHANRPPASVPELIDSLGAAWLVLPQAGFIAAFKPVTSPAR